LTESVLKLPEKIGMLLRDAAEPEPIAVIGTTKVLTPLLKVTELNTSEVGPATEKLVMIEPLPCPIAFPLGGPIRKMKLSVSVPLNPFRLIEPETVSVPDNASPNTENIGFGGVGKKLAALAAGL
jgi:hypothetical protein